ncbi:pyridoxamine 5'-phosphate oxidase family protein [Curtobacterium sp. ISL-83]|uniref:pyridoxamine 5'-phosphate oxidase family protein n=1 Tax=Curtobacterium sp. ISL-83 TaxID=2819145 RepID=UPI001BE79DDB|nr:pyridoxamine 5'-phosphate oxidase family protein [Curtobacterium sp. ISL-83]MBT2502227.1 pyridoxamine 5'-phosphate oxidase family protein [Curtobacterium sp. ISL-83]
MSRQYGCIAFTPGVDAEQEAYGSADFYRQIAERGAGADGGDALSDRETTFLAERDSFYLATVGQTGWPYVQFRGGPPGFLHVFDPSTIAWADYQGNLQHVSTGNLRDEDRVAIIAVDYATRKRLKLYGRATVTRRGDRPDLFGQLRHPFDAGAVIERAVVVTIAAFDWNCPQHIPRKYTEEQVTRLTQPLRDRVAALEAEVTALRG